MSKNDQHNPKEYMCQLSCFYHENAGLMISDEERSAELSCVTEQLWLHSAPSTWTTSDYGNISLHRLRQAYNVLHLTDTKGPSRLYRGSYVLKFYRT